MGPSDSLTLSLGGHTRGVGDTDIGSDKGSESSYLSAYGKDLLLSVRLFLS